MPRSSKARPSQTGVTKSAKGQATAARASVRRKAFKRVQTRSAPRTPGTTPKPSGSSSPMRRKTY